MKLNVKNYTLNMKFFRGHQISYNYIVTVYIKGNFLLVRREYEGEIEIFVHNLNGIESYTINKMQ